MTQGNALTFCKKNYWSKAINTDDFAFNDLGKAAVENLYYLLLYCTLLKDKRILNGSLNLFDS